ncbi:palmitoyltransferase pfa5 [Pleosporales sp. CAS-2024a]
MAPFVVGSQKPQARNKTTALEQKIGVATAVAMPLLELGAIAFVTWVVCYLICIRYLIAPSPDLQHDFGVLPRRGTGTAVIAVYALLLLMLLLPWMRLLQVMWTKQDTLPCNAPTTEKAEADSAPMEQYDAYICDYEGAPLFCDKCRIFKPDRAHHCKELGRCISRMDHFCPWAGGIVAQHSHKFFLQLVFFAALYTTYLWIVVAVFLADRNSKTGSRPGPWIGALAVGVMFCIFTSTMTCMTSYNLAINYTSVEAIQRGGISNIAFRITAMPTGPPVPHSPPTSSDDNVTKERDDGWPVLRTVRASNGNLFVVMQTKPFQHPWAGTMMDGWKDTMGMSPLDWFLPLRHSPSTQKHGSGEHKWGFVVYDMAAKYEEENPGSRLALLESRR